MYSNASTTARNFTVHLRFKFKYGDIASHWESVSSLNFFVMSSKFRHSKDKPDSHLKIPEQALSCCKAFTYRNCTQDIMCLSVTKLNLYLMCHILSPRFSVLAFFLWLCSSTMFSQNNIYVIAGINKYFPNANLKIGNVNPVGKYGFLGGIGVERKIKKNYVSLEISYSSNNLETTIGPFFFPGDSPFEPGSFYHTKYYLKNVNVVPTFNCSLIKKILYIPVGIVMQKTFTSMDTKLIRPDNTYEDNNFTYKIPDYNIAIYTGLNLNINPKNSPTFFISFRYFMNLFRMNPIYPEYKKLNISIASFSTGVKF